MKKKKCCNPFGRPHSKKVSPQRISGDLIPMYQRVFPNFDWSGEKYICTQCSFDMKKSLDALRTVAGVVQLARKSTSKLAGQARVPRTNVVEPQPGPSRIETASQGPRIPLAEQPLPDVHGPQEPGTSASVISVSGFAPSAPLDEESDHRSDMSVSESESSDQMSTSSSPVNLGIIDSNSDVSGNPGSTLSAASGSVTGQSDTFPSSPSLVPSTFASTLQGIEDRHRLDTTLGGLEVTPITAAASKRPYAVKKTLSKAQKALKHQFEKVTKKNIDLSTPPKQKGCFFCDELLKELVERFPEISSKGDKYKCLTCVPKRFTIRDIETNFKVSMTMAKNASSLRNSEGAFSAPTFNYGHPLSKEVCDLVKQFYLSSDNSRVSPNLNETILVKNDIGEKVPASKHRILCNLNELYMRFTQKYENVKVSESKFATLRPKNCVWPGRRGFHNTCLCEMHQNFQFMLEAFTTDETVDSFIEKTVCSPANSECYIGLCLNCPKMTYIEGLFGHFEEEEEVVFKKWTHTDATDIKTVIMELDEFREEFEAFVPKLIQHDYVFKRQRNFINSLKTDTLQNKTSVTVHVDFAQNYSFIVQNAVQGFHWSNRQATIHPFVVHWWGEETGTLEFRTYCVISNELSHDADTFHAFRCEVMPLILEDLSHLNLNLIYYISDGAASQYKNFKNFANLASHEADFGIKAEWHFTATAHGKSTCDAISGVVKSSTRIESLKPGKFITTPEDMFRFCVDKLSSPTLSIVYVDKSNVIQKRTEMADRYKLYKTIPGTRKYHMFRPEQNVMHMQLTSSSPEETGTKYNFLLGETTVYALEDLQIGSFYAFSATSNYQIGMVVETNQAEGEALIQSLKINRRNGLMQSPNPLLFLEVPLRDIFCQVSDPITDNGIVYKFVDNDFVAVKAAFRTFKGKNKRS